MDKRKLMIRTLALGAIAFFVMQGDLSAVETTSKFSSSDISSHADDISSFIFGPVARVAGVLGGGYGLISAVLSSSVRPLVTFGGIGLGVALVPKFINSVFTLLLP